MSYRVELSRQAKQAFLALRERDRRLLGRRLLELAENPTPRGAQALTRGLGDSAEGFVSSEGGKGHYRLRAGDHRIVYAVQDEQLLVRVVRIGPRRSVYGDAERGA